MWRRLFAGCPILARLPEPDRQPLIGLARRFVAEKSFEPAGELELSESMCLTIAAQACVPVLHLGLDWYRGWRSVVVYPAGFLARQEYVDEIGVVHEVERPLSGEAWPQGPVVLAWDHVRRDALGQEWGNLAIHEFAHKLDLANGVCNGMPPLHPDMRRERWTRALATAYEDLVSRLATAQWPPFDEGATEDPGEFFAVMSEAFFAHSEDLFAWYPDVYGVLAAFYRQDPLSGARPE